MGFVIKVIDLILFFFFLVIGLAAPLIDAQTVLSHELFPKFLIDLKKWYVGEYNDYLFTEKPLFIVGIVWLELLFQWPLSIASLYGIVAGKSWLRTTCLIFGASTFTSMVTILAELTGSGKASDKLLMMYFPFLGFSVLAILRAFLPHSGKTTSIGKKPVLNRKKRA